MDTLIFGISIICLLIAAYFAGLASGFQRARKMLKEVMRDTRP